MAHGSPHDLAQHVPAPLVGGHDAVGDEERHRTKVVGNDAHGDVLPRGKVLALLLGEPLALPWILGRSVDDAGHLSNPVDDGREQVRVVVGQLSLDDRRDPLEAHAGVHRERRQRHERAVGLAVELHEDVVPDLDEAIAVAVDALADRLGAGDVVAPEVVDLRAAAAGAGLAHRPEVLGQAELGDARGGHEAGPHAERLVVSGDAGLALEDGGVETVGLQLPDRGQQLPGERDGVGLEVVAEREVAEHLEERVMAQRRADVVEVVVLARDAHALLARRRANVVAPLAAEKHVLELVHPGVGEEQRRVVARHERRAGHDAVPLGLEVVQEPAADFTRGHGRYCTRDSGLGTRYSVLGAWDLPRVLARSLESEACSLFKSGSAVCGARPALRSGGSPVARGTDAGA